MRKLDGACGAVLLAAVLVLWATPACDGDGTAGNADVGSAGDIASRSDQVTQADLAPLEDGGADLGRPPEDVIAVPETGEADGSEVGDTLADGAGEAPPRETRLDLICVGERCAAGPDHAPDPSLPGPFPVGVRTFVYVDEHPFHEARGPRTLRTEIWYPTTEEHRDGPFVVYDLMRDSPPELAHIFEGLQGIEGLPSKAVRDAPLRAADGPYPLVFFSHGAYGVRFQNVYQTVHLASHGYIVVSPDHQRNTTWDYLENGYDSAEVVWSAMERAGDGEYLLDRMFELADDPESFLHDNVATKRVGFTGHSFGGFLSLVFGALDERVSVIVPISPASTAAGLVAGVDLGSYPVPVLFIGGDADETLEFDIEMWQPYLRTATPKAFLRVFRGGHYTFTDMCSVDVATLALELGWGDAEDALTDGCGEENFDPATARAVTNHYSTAMFNRYLRLSADSRAYLSQERIADYAGEIAFYDELD